MNFGYIIVEEFNQYHDGWSNYIASCKLPHLQEVITLDTGLAVIVDISDYQDVGIYTSYLESGYELCNNLEWIIDKYNNFKGVNLLGVSYNPTSDCSNRSVDSRFQFCGYDLIEDFSGISALLNCGGFPKAFSETDLTEQGLIMNFNRAREIQNSLIKYYPNESHADCSIYAFWKFKSNVKL